MLRRIHFVRNMRTGSGVRRSSELLKRLNDPTRSSKIAFVDDADGQAYTYKQLNDASASLASVLNGKVLRDTSSIGCFNKSNASFVVTMLATWKLGKTFVPLCLTHSENELNYLVGDSKLGAIVCSKDADLNPSFKASQTTIPFISTDALGLRTLKPTSDKPIVPNADIHKDALVIYTSGTTGRPKGVVHSDDGVTHMITSLINAWEYNDQDKILHFLPLYHVHGLVNKLLCVLWAGGTVEFAPSAKADVLWRRLADESRPKVADPDQKALSMFMAVPTVYAKMIEASKVISTDELQLAVKTMQSMRFMACGSAALPDTVMNDWKALTGHTLLERYGMTELGMALSNPLTGERRKGYVGQPLEGVQCRLVDDDEKSVLEPEKPGELRVKGPTVFKRYLNLPAVTADSFDAEGWFRTGDIAEKSSDGYYKILGRNSTDIIKSSGYKLSALEIERELLGHLQIMEAAVIGVADPMLGESILAILSLRTDVLGSSINTELYPDLLISKDSARELESKVRHFLKDRLAPYKHPRKVIVVDAIPRNHLGKVNKKRLVQDLNITL